LHVVSRSAPAWPHWGQLYVALGVIAVVGAAAHFTVESPSVLKVVDAAFAFVIFAALAGWVHMNRLALARMGEPDTTGTSRPRIRIVRSRDRSAEQVYVEDGVVRLDPNERVTLPYDFR
jgi:hypothetical protein